jgi:methionyl-tRNA formyltransferase
MTINLAYFADGPWSHWALDLLLARADINIVFICSRHRCPDQTLKLIAERENIPFLNSPNINSKDFLRLIKNLLTRNL